MINMDLYDVNDDEVNQITGGLDGFNDNPYTKNHSEPYVSSDNFDDNPFTISHPEPYVRPAIALNLSNQQISELRGVCFTDSFALPQKVNDKEGCHPKMPNSCSRYKPLNVRLFAIVMLIIGWVSFFTLILSDAIEQIEVDTTNRWTVFTFILMILILATVCTRKMLSRHQNKSDLSSSFPPSMCLPCFKSREEETSILYSVNT